MPFLASVSARQGGVVLANSSGPGAPTSVTASLPSTYGNTTASVSWTAPTFLGSPPLNDYVIQYSSDSGSNWTTFSDTVSTATSVTVTGLTNGTAYIFRVAAKNAALTGPYSSSSNSVTPLFGKVPTPIVLDIAETTNSIPWCFDNYASIDQANGYVYNYYNYTPGQPPNDQSGSCHGWTGLAENVYRETYLYVSKTGWANSDSIFLAETTNVTPPDFTPACTCCYYSTVTEYRCIDTPQGLIQQVRTNTVYSGAGGATGGNGPSCSGTCTGNTCTAQTIEGTWSNTGNYC